MKLEPNMYVRTKNGLIAKYIGYEKNEDDIEFSKYNFDGKIYWYYEYYNDYVYEEDFEEWFKEEVIKTSHNIIDLIKVEDYVNGYRVDYIENINKNNNFILQRIFCEEYEKDLYSKSFKPSDIKSIVTKEQFESISYKVGDSNEYR